MLGKRLRAPLVALILCLLACAPAAASPGLRLGLMDDALLTNRPDLAWPWIQQLVPQVLRYDVDWPLVAPVRPRNASNPLDPGYRWRSIDDVVMLARRQGIPVVLTIDHTPAWAGGGASHIRAPRHLLDLRRFAHAAATRYAGLVSRWTAWNEPNLPDSLQPQIRLERGRIVPASPAVYAGLLRAIYDGVHQAGRERHVPETVAAGDTSPYGCGPRCKPASLAPLTFLRALAKLHARFDVWAHHPYRI